MKKAIYLLAAIALMASCNQEVLVDTPEPQPEAPRRIGFETFVNKATRANSTALNDFYPTFNVYGWKTVGGDVTCVFDNVSVGYYDVEDENTIKPGDEWGEAVTGWYYENIRYWDKMASQYQFSAYVPAAASGVVACTKDGVIKIGTDAAPITVEGKNLMATPATALAFTGYEYDYMTAQSTTPTSPVALTFKHLQAKFNVRIKLAASVTTAQDVSVQKIEVHNLGDVAYYVSDAAAPAVDGWTLGTPTATYVPKVETPYSLNAATNYHNHYVMEQLIIPQTIKKSTAVAPSLTEYAEACIYVEYTIGTEVFKSFTPLANLFIGSAADESYTFKAGNQYTLNINIGPEPIEFTAEVATWAEEIQGNHNIN